MNARTIAFLCALTPAALAAQSSNIVGVIVAAGTGEPLAYGIVSLKGTELTTFTSDSGHFGFRNLGAGPHVVHARRLGYTPREVIIDLKAGVTDSIRIELDHVAVSLGKITVRAWPPCNNPGAPTLNADSALQRIVEQVRLNAEQFRFLAEQYPFSYEQLISQHSRLKQNGMTVGAPATSLTYRSKEMGKTGYKPGEVIYRRSGADYFRIPTLSDVADARFVSNHCWHYGGIESIDDEDAYRVDVVTFDSLKGTDVNGSFYVDKNSFQIRRSVLHLNKRPKQFPDLLDMETTTDYFEVMTSISIPSHIYSVQRIDPEAKKPIVTEIMEEHRTINFKFLGRKPGEAKP